jgi:hypothetical protein
MPKLIPALILAVALVGLGTTPALAGGSTAGAPCPITVPKVDLPQLDVGSLCGLLGKLQVKLALEHVTITLQAILDGALHIVLGALNLTLNVVLPTLLSLPVPVISLALSLPSIGLYLVLFCLLGH